MDIEALTSSLATLSLGEKPVSGKKYILKKRVAPTEEKVVPVTMSVKKKLVIRAKKPRWQMTAEEELEEELSMSAAFL